MVIPRAGWTPRWTPWGDTRINSSLTDKKEQCDIKYSARYEGQKSGGCYSTDVWMMKNDESTLNVFRLPNGDIRFSKYVNLKPFSKTQHKITLKSEATMFDSFFCAYFKFMHDKQRRASCPVTIPHPPSRRQRLLGGICCIVIQPLLLLYASPHRGAWGCVLSGGGERVQGGLTD